MTSKRPGEDSLRKAMGGLLVVVRPPVGGPVMVDNRRSQPEPSTNTKP
jgi:hypothetical protein